MRVATIKVFIPQQIQTTPKDKHDHKRYDSNNNIQFHKLIIICKYIYNHIISKYFLLIYHIKNEYYNNSISKLFTNFFIRIFGNLLLIVILI